MLKQSAAILLLGAGFAGAAISADLAYPVSDETGTAYRAAEYALRAGKLVRVDHADGAPAVAPATPASEWLLVAGDTGWELKPHAYDISQGRLVHADEFAHDTPRPSLAGETTSAPQDSPYAGG